MYDISSRPTWDEYFMMLAKLTATRSTCLAFPVGAVIVKDRQVLSTGYNGSPSGSAHCTTQGYCYPEVSACNVIRALPSRSVHAEANAISKVARSTQSCENSTLYITLSPCKECSKLIHQSGIKRVVYKNGYRDTSGIDFLVKAGIEVMQIEELD